MDVLVTGATGFVGGRLVPELLDADHSVHVLVRDATSYDAPSDVTVHEGDLLEPGSFEGAVAEVEAAYYLVHSMRAGEDYAERDRRAARNFADAASEAGVERAIYLGGLGEEGDVLSDHLKSRREVESVLAEGDYDLTVLRAAIIVGGGSISFETISQLATRLPVMITPKWVHNDCQPIAIDDVLAYMVGLLEKPETADETYEIGGPDVMTYGEMLRRVAPKLGSRKPIIIPVPVLTPQLSAYWVGLVTSVDWQVARPLIDGLRNPVVVTDDAIRDVLPIELTPYEEAVTQAVERQRDAEGDA